MPAKGLDQAMSMEHHDEREDGGLTAVIPIRNRDHASKEEEYVVAPPLGAEASDKRVDP